MLPGTKSMIGVTWQRQESGRSESMFICSYACFNLIEQNNTDHTIKRYATNDSISCRCKWSSSAAFGCRHSFDGFVSSCLAQDLQTVRWNRLGGKWLLSGSRHRVGSVTLVMYFKPRGCKLESTDMGSSKTLASIGLFPSLFSELLIADTVANARHWHGRQAPNESFWALGRDSIIALHIKVSKKKN